VINVAGLATLRNAIQDIRQTLFNRSTNQTARRHSEVGMRSCQTQVGPLVVFVAVAAAEAATGSSVCGSCIVFVPS